MRSVKKPSPTLLFPTVFNFESHFTLAPMLPTQPEQASPTKSLVYIDYIDILSNGSILGPLRVPITPVLLTKSPCIFPRLPLFFPARV